MRLIMLNIIEGVRAFIEVYSLVIESIINGAAK